MKPPWYESRGLIPWMILLAIFLAGAVSIKEGWFAFIDFTANKDEIDGITKIFGLALLVIGGILSYLRFFRGRTLRPKLNISPKIGVIPLKGENLHWIDVEIENRGSVSIWNHEITIYATLHAPEPYCVRIIEYVSTVKEGKIQEHLIDVGESSHEHAYLRVPNNIHAITYQIVVNDDRKTTWDRCITGGNSQPKDKSESE
jgi:hypothetical protein